MNRWAARHLVQLQAGLEPGEEVLAADRVVIPKARGRNKVAEADRSGFPIPGTIFVLGVSTKRVLFWRATKAMALPVELMGSVPLEEVAAVRVVRRLWISRIAVLLEAGPMLVAKPLWGRGVREVSSAFAAVRN